ncbi:MAG: hypothetical protein K0A98_09130 [Trueperaceae bacterium]|nr:hypothetical protein [Trueperaceae bacterium]
MVASRDRPEFAGRFAVHGAAGARGGLALPMLVGLPIGTTVEAAFHDADPASGAAPVTTLAMTVGVDSEAAFGEALADARAAAVDWETAYLVVTTSEVRRTIDLPEDGAAATPGRPWGASALRLPLVGLVEGDTVTVELCDGDPADGGNLLETLAFAYGTDSAIGFRAAVEIVVGGRAFVGWASGPQPAHGLGRVARGPEGAPAAGRRRAGQPPDVAAVLQPRELALQVDLRHLEAASELVDGGRGRQGAQDLDAQGHSAYTPHASR